MKHNNNYLLVGHLRDLYSRQPFDKRMIIKNKIIEECAVTPTTFNRWLNGTSRPTRKSQAKIENILATEDLFY